jgi:HD superfamily phosphodiesterase
MKRFRVQHLDLAAGTVEAKRVKEYDSLPEARAECDALWALYEIPTRQEIRDSKTGERWVRAAGSLEWQLVHPVGDDDTG